MEALGITLTNINFGMLLSLQTTDIAVETKQRNPLCDWSYLVNILLEHLNNHEQDTVQQTRTLYLEKTALKEFG